MIEEADRYSDREGNHYEIASPLVTHVETNLTLVVYKDLQTGDFYATNIDFFKANGWKLWDSKDWDLWEDDIHKKALKGKG